MHSGPFAEFACPLPAADYRQYVTALSSSGKFCCCPSTAAQQDNGHIVFDGLQPSAGPPIWQICPGSSRCLWCGQNSFPDLPSRLAGSYHSPQIAVVHKENPAGRTITKLLLLLTWSQTIRDISFGGQLAEKRQKLTQHALPTTCAQATRLPISLAAMFVLPPLASLGPKKRTDSLHHSTPTWRMWTCSLVKRHSRIWTSNLPSRRQSPDNPSFDCSR